MRLKTSVTKATLYWRNFGAVFFSVVGAFLVDPVWSWIFDKEELWKGIVFIFSIVFILPLILAVAPALIVLFYCLLPKKRFLPSILAYSTGLVLALAYAWYYTIDTGYNAFTDIVFISIYAMILFSFAGSMWVSAYSYTNKPKVPDARLEDSIQE